MSGYIPRSENVVQVILKDHFSNFEAEYVNRFSADYGKFNLPRISDSVEKFIDCGDYSKGIARIQCTNKDCNHEYFRPFSCKQWYLCPSCHQKRQLLFSEHLCEETLLKLPHRQYVFTIPKILRPFFRHDRMLFAEVSRMISAIVQDYYNELSGKELTTALVISFQTYGDMLRFHPHWHCIILEGGIDADARFVHLPFGDTKNLREVFRRKVIGFFTRKGLLNEKLAANLLTWVNSGFSVDNSVRLLPHNDKAQSNLAQYIARHPFSLKKIHYIREKGTVLYLTKFNPVLKENIKLFQAPDFIAELTQHIPPKGKHLIRYYGLYSSRTLGKNAESGSLEKFKAKRKVEIKTAVLEPSVPQADKKKCSQTWARLIQKVYETDPMVCPECGSGMKITAVITEPLAVQSILRYLEKKGMPPFGLPKANSPPERKVLTA